MKANISYLFSLVYVVIALGVINTNDLSQEIMYFNPKPPSLSPQLFCPHVFNYKDGYHSPIIFVPGGQAFLSLVTRNLSTKMLNLTDGKWSHQRAIDFGITDGIGNPTLSPNGKRLLFLSFEPLPTDPVKRERIWFVDKTESGWTTPKLLSEKIARHPTHWTFSVSANQNVYFLSELDGGQDIFVSRYIDDTYQEPTRLGPLINTSESEFCPFIAPDESYLIFTRVGRNTKKADLFISFRNSNNTWTKATRFDDTINSDENEVAPVVTVDNKYLFFLSTKSGTSRIYWVSHKVIENYKSN